MRLLIFFLFILSCTLLHAQKDVETWVEGRFKAGFLMAHRSSMGHLANEHAFASEVSFMFQTRGEKAWNSRFRDPIYGVTLFSGTVGSKKYLGSYYGIYGFMNFPFVKYKGYTLSGKMGSGLGYGTKVYDPEMNILNVAISTHFNAQICLGLNSSFVFGRNALSVMLDMTHFSNGSTKVPNLGINVPFVSVAYAYKVKEKQSTERVEKFELKQKRYEYGIIAIGSVQEVSPGYGDKFPFFGLNFVGRRFFGGKSAMEVSFDIFSKQSIKNYQPDIEKSQLDIIQLGLYCGYIIPMDRVHIIIGMGAYLRDKYKPADPMYHRLGLRYVFPAGWNMNLTLKSHWARADYIEYGIGYTFTK